VIEVRVAEYLLLGGIAIQVSRKSPGTRHILQIDGGMRNWEEVPANPATNDPAVTIALEDDEARALLDALLRHYQGASDMHTVRSDLLHERGRVDKLTEAIIRIASPHNRSPETDRRLT